MNKVQRFSSLIKRKLNAEVEIAEVNVVSKGYQTPGLDVCRRNAGL